MKTLYDAHGKKKRVKVSATEIVEHNDTRLLNNAMSKRIVLMYMKIVRRTVLAGHEFRFHNGMKLSVRKERVDGSHGYSNYMRDENGDKKKVFNLRRPNERYSVECHGGPLGKIRYRFEPSLDFRKKLNHRLRNTDTIYSHKGAL